MFVFQANADNSGIGMVVTWMCAPTSWGFVMCATTGHMPVGLACDIGVFSEDGDETLAAYIAGLLKCPDHTVLPGTI